MFSYLYQCSILPFSLRLLGAYLFLTLFDGGLFKGRTYSRGEGVIATFDICHLKGSLSWVLFSIILKEQSKFRHWSFSKSSSSSGVETYLKGAY